MLLVVVLGPDVGGHLAVASTMGISEIALERKKIVSAASTVYVNFVVKERKNNKLASIRSRIRESRLERPCDRRRVGDRCCSGLPRATLASYCGQQEEVLGTTRALCILRGKVSGTHELDEGRR
jgi:hypothetical protein